VWFYVYQQAKIDMKFDNNNKKTGMNRVVSAFKNTCKGFFWMSKNEAAFKQEVILMFVLTVISFYLDVTVLEHIFLIVSLLLVILTETLNTAIEAVVDRIGLEFHELSGLAKDLGSAAVFISLTIVVVVWGGILCF
jgi:diacylglycerol kinase (ATP)